jgi:hypothetical protein
MRGSPWPQANGDRHVFMPGSRSDLRRVPPRQFFASAYGNHFFRRHELYPTRLEDLPVLPRNTAVSALSLA